MSEKGTDREKWDTPPGHFGSKTDEWSTPPELLRSLEKAVGGFDLDPCSGAERKSIAEQTYTAEDDGLKQAWFGTVWCNPPYSDMESWMQKAVNESNREDVDLVLVLAPARTSTQWFHKYATKADAVAFLEGRLTFGDPREQVRNAPFPSIIAVFGEYPEDLGDTLDRRGMVYRSDQRDQRTQQTVIA
ncbi:MULTISPECIES: DNA N-6-adenine-methyltransferase [Halobacteriales]|uniref:Phage N-6-adenine-methyltransferase n=2 Tax=Halobacteriales TaxID=2235 RepID=A0A1I0R0P9_9EURY|nr:DNA N-6-adenine-methyltransferase [Natrinema salifodinae]SEW33063.1 phage N-6-adenine-methyltransferase [Natrinema salifodinae]